MLGRTDHLGRDIPSTAEPIGKTSVMAQLNEALGYLSTLERHCSDMDGSLFGRGQNDPKPSPVSTTLESMAAEACHRAASLCGWLATIKQSLGCEDSVEPLALPPDNRLKSYLDSKSVRYTDVR